MDTTHEDHALVAKYILKRKIF